MTDRSPETGSLEDHPVATGEWTDRLFDRHDPPGAYDGETGAAFDRWQVETRERLRETLGHTVVERAGRDDDIFPIHGVRRAVEHLRPIYEAAGADAAEAVDLFVGDGGHRYFEDAAWSFVAAHR